jgi:hypothetical protein
LNETLVIRRRTKQSGEALISPQGITTAKAFFLNDRNESDC